MNTSPADDPASLSSARLSFRQIEAMEASPAVEHVLLLIAEIRRLKRGSGQEADAVLRVAEYDEFGCGCDYVEVLSQMATQIGRAGLRKIIGNVRRASTRAFNAEKKGGAF